MAHDSTFYELFYELTLKRGRILMGHPDTLPKNGSPMRLPIGAWERGFVTSSSLIHKKRRINSWKRWKSASCWASKVHPRGHDAAKHSCATDNNRANFRVVFNP